MVPDSSLPCPQEHATGHYSEPDELIFTLQLLFKV
jgi:hypothetical protein